MARRVSLSQQIEEVDRELDQRASVYPRLVSAGKLRLSVSQYHMERMEAARATLAWLQRHERTLRQRCPDLFGEG